MWKFFSSSNATGTLNSENNYSILIKKIIIVETSRLFLFFNFFSRPTYSYYRSTAHKC